MSSQAQTKTVYGVSGENGSSCFIRSCLAYTPVYVALSLTPSYRLVAILWHNAQVGSEKVEKVFNEAEI